MKKHKQIENMLESRIEDVLWWQNAAGLEEDFNQLLMLKIHSKAFIGLRNRTCYEIKELNSET